ncbi:hypothetical protein [Actinomadura sp. NPDC049753]|uniref:hypothetical protein n=1 Tax=Actinomadura sp. NPDC049753 TaxID=3154739 RepID=UPI00344391C0
MTACNPGGHRRYFALVDGVPAGAADYRSTLELAAKANAAAFTVKPTIQVQGSTLPAGSAADFEHDCDHPCATNSSLTGSMARSLWPATSGKRPPSTPAGLHLTGRGTSLDGRRQVRASRTAKPGEVPEVFGARLADLLRARGAEALLTSTEE